MNSKNSKTSDPHLLIINLPDEINLKRSDKYAALPNLSVYCTWKIQKKSYRNNKVKISAPTWSIKFDLPDGSYSTSNILDYFDYIVRMHNTSLGHMTQTLTDNSSTIIYISKIENRITFKIKTGYYCERRTQ